MQTQRSADVASGWCVSLLGLLVLVAATQITGGMEERLPPRTLPYAVGVTILVTGALLAFRSWRAQGGEAPIKWPDRVGAGRNLVTLVSLGLFIAALDPLGMPLATVLFTAFLIWYLERKRFWYPALIGLISGAVVYLLFIRFLELSLPVGPLAP